MKTTSTLLNVLFYVLATLGALAVIGLIGMAIMRSIMMGAM